MIDCLDKQQQQQHQQHATSQFWLQQQQQHQQVALQQQQQQPQLYQKHVLVDTTTQQPIQTELQQVASNNNNNNNNELIGYYFGSISRETAEWVLKNHGNNLDGAYLLRSSGPKDDFVLSLMVVHEPSVNQTTLSENNNNNNLSVRQAHLEVLHYKIVETEDSFVALHGQVGDEKFATIDELIEKAQGVATKPKWPIQRQSLESQILPPTFWGLTVDQVRLAILIKAKQWGFPLSIFQQPSMPTYQVESCSLQKQQQQQQQQQYILNASLNDQTDLATESLTGGDSVSQQAKVNGAVTTTTLNNETIRTLIYKSLHEFQPWFHGNISREDAERRIEDGQPRDGRFLVRERDNYSYAMCISHKKTTKHYRIDVLPTGELAIQDGRKFTSLMALISHYTIMSDGLWCALTEPCPRPIYPAGNNNNNTGFQTLQGRSNQFVTQTQAVNNNNNNNIYCIPPSSFNGAHRTAVALPPPVDNNTNPSVHSSNRREGQPRGESATNGTKQTSTTNGALICPNQGAAVLSIRAPIKEWLHTMNHKWSQLIASKTNAQHQSLNSFLFGSSNPLNNHCHHHRNHHNHNHNHHHHHNQTRNPSHNHHNHNHNQQQQQQHRHRRCTKNGCSKHQNQQQQQQTNALGQRQHKTPNNNNNANSQQHQTMMTKPICDCCCSNNNNNNNNNNHNTLATIDPYQQQDALQTMIQNRMQPAGGPLPPPPPPQVVCGGTLKSLPPPPPPNNLILQHHVGSHATNGTNNSNNGNNSNGGGDQFATGSGGGIATQAVASHQASIDYTKALLSCLPQNSGFMLDSQSFIGSPLFAVKSAANCSGKTTSSAAAPIDGSAFARNGWNRANSMNGAMGASGGRRAGSGSGSGSGLGGCGNNVCEEEKLISPAQSISANLNSHHNNNNSNNNNNNNSNQQQHTVSANPYNLKTDIYGSQTSTAIVNDHLLTSSSSSSGNNNHLGQRQQSIDLTHHRPVVNPQAHAPPPPPPPALHSDLGRAYGATQPSTAISSLHGGGGGIGMMLVSGGCAQSNAIASTLPAQARAAIAGDRAKLTSYQMPTQHAGPIFCGQHAGPAYRYTNCTGDQSLLRPCYHSRGALGGGGGGVQAHQQRAVDDLQLTTTPSSQMGGPAALTKFVQFQDGQCLRTHRDTRSIQMAYLLSRQEALNVLNSRNPQQQQQQSINPSGAATLRPTMGQMPLQNYNNNNNNPHPMNGHNNNAPLQNNRWPQHQFASNNNNHQQQQQHINGASAQNGITQQLHHHHQQQQDQTEFDLMDCDGKGFQFKYDPKLIKSSSIETLCGIGNGDDDDDGPDCLGDLSNFKSHSELLMSLKSCWPNYGGDDDDNNDSQHPIEHILSPIVASQATSNLHITSPPDPGKQQGNEFMVTPNYDCLASMMMMNQCPASGANHHQTTSGGDQIDDESVRRKHDLDELTTSLLAELTASLKAQIDLKNRRSGLCTASQVAEPPPPQDASASHNGGGGGSSTQHDNNNQDKTTTSELDPRDLINEFDTLIKQGKGD